MNEEILKKLKELNDLIEAEKKEHNKTLVDFFRPIAKQMLNQIEYRLKGIVLSKRDRERISKVFQDIDAEYILENSAGVDELDNELKELINQNKLIEAVKLKAKKSGLGLRESKDYIDLLRLNKI